MLFFDMKRETLTPKGKMNFIGAVHKYFDSYTQGINQTTRDTYINRYETMIFPYVNTAFPMSEYSEENLEELLSVIGEETNYSRLSINTDIRCTLIELILIASYGSCQIHISADDAVCEYSVAERNTPDIYLV